MYGKPKGVVGAACARNEVPVGEVRSGRGWFAAAGLAACFALAAGCNFHAMRSRGDTLVFGRVSAWQRVGWTARIMLARETEDGWAVIREDRISGDGDLRWKLAPGSYAIVGVSYAYGSEVQGLFKQYEVPLLAEFSVFPDEVAVYVGTLVLNKDGNVDVVDDYGRTVAEMKPRPSADPAIRLLRISPRGRVLPTPR